MRTARLNVVISSVHIFLYELQELVDAKNEGLGEQIRGNAGLGAKVRQASALVQRLDRVMRIHLANRQAELVEWERSKRMRPPAAPELIPATNV